MKPQHQTLYQILDNYIKIYGDPIVAFDQLRYALVDLNEIMDFARHRMETNITAEQAKQISEVGLQWVSYAQINPESSTDFASEAEKKLENSPTAP